MSLDVFSSLFGSFLGRRKSKKAYKTNRRALRLECLETRTVLSASVAAGVAVVNNTPSISKLVVSSAAHEITWNASAADGISSSSIAIDGVTQSSVYGPYNAAPGENYAWLWNSSSGNHTYLITAVNAAGTSTQVSGTFTVPAGPTISQVTAVMSASPAQLNITWLASSPHKVSSSTLALDGTAVTSGIYGPYSFDNAWAYSAVLPLPTEGSHTYSITATDGLGDWSQYTHTVVVGPTISHVAVSTAQGQISWIASDPTGITSSNIVIEGVGTPSLYGPYEVSPGLAYSCLYGGLTQGTYTYAIVATDAIGDTTQITGTFTV